MSSPLFDSIRSDFSLDSLPYVVSYIMYEPYWNDTTYDVLTLIIFTLGSLLPNADIFVIFLLADLYHRTLSCYAHEHTQPLSESECIYIAIASLCILMKTLFLPLTLDCLIVTLKDACYFNVDVNFLDKIQKEIMTIVQGQFLRFDFYDACKPNQRLSAYEYLFKETYLQQKTEEIVKTLQEKQTPTILRVYLLMTKFPKLPMRQRVTSV